jgi:transcriptional regulator with XRE-family HTH domain
MGRLYDIIQRHIDAQPYLVSVRKVAQALDVTPSTVSNWRNPESLVKKEHLEAIARVTGTPYQEVLDALLADIGYAIDDDTEQGSETA